MRVSPWVAQLQKQPSYLRAQPQLSLQLLDGIRHGVRIGFTGDRTRALDAPNLGSATKDPAVRALISDIIAADVAAGKKAGPFDAPPQSDGGTAFCVSPIGAVPKPGSAQIRVIHHLSYPFGGDSINAGIAPEELSLARFDDACDGVRAERARTGRAPLLTKLDVEAAYKQVPVHPDDRALLGLRWEGKYYNELVLPFGLRSSGNRWELYAAALHHFIQHHVGVTLVVHYVDDFLLIDADEERARRALTETLALCARLGIPMAERKTEGPCTRLVFLGIEIDTQTMRMQLGEKRLFELRRLLTHWGGQRTISQKELQSLTGKLNFAANVVRRGRAYLRRLIDLARELGALPGNTPKRQHRITREAMRDICWWRDFIAQWNGHSLLYELEWEKADKFETGAGRACE